MKTFMTFILCAFCAISINAQWCNKPDANFCQDNYFTNGNFENITGNPSTKRDQDINLAVGWQPLWRGNSLADLHCTGQGLSAGATPTPNSNVFAGMWINNRSAPSNDVTYREGMYNKLATPIQKNSGQYTFAFDVANAMLTKYTEAEIGIYGVYNPSGKAASTPTGLNQNPTNLSLWDSVDPSIEVVLLGIIKTPSNFSNKWISRSVTFDSNNLNSNSITHIMITSYDRSKLKYSKIYMNFDNYCLQTADAPPTEPFDPCCPPLSKSSMPDLFTPVFTGTSNSSYQMNFTANQNFQNRMQAYIDLLKLTCGADELHFSWNLCEMGTGASPANGYCNNSIEKEYFHFNANGGGVIQNAAYQNTGFFNTANCVPNTWYRITCGIYPNNKLKNCFEVSECSNELTMDFRWTLQGNMRTSDPILEVRGLGRNLKMQKGISANTKIVKSKSGQLKSGF